MKVYCKECKYFSLFWYYTGTREACNKVYKEEKHIIQHSGTPITRPYEEERVDTLYCIPKETNKNNDCPHFKDKNAIYYSEKWYIKLWRIFK